MRLVKAAALGFLFACTDPAPDALHGSSDADCRLVLARPLGPHLKTLAPDGSIHDEGALACAACVMGSPGGFALRDADGVRVRFAGVDRRIQPPAGTRVGSSAVPGVLVGATAAVLHHEAGLDVIDARGALPARIALPPLADDEHLTGFQRHGDRLSLTATGCEPDAVRRVDAEDADPFWIHARDESVVARFDARPATAVIFTSGERVALPRESRVLSSEGDATKVIVRLRNALWIVWQTGAVDVLTPGHSATVMRDGSVLVFDSIGRTIQQHTAPGQRRTLIAPPAHLDLAGAPLPARARVKKMMGAVHDSTAFVIERIENNACSFEDRVHLVDLVTTQVRTLVSGDGMRMTPIRAGDRFAFVEADVELSLP